MAVFIYSNIRKPDTIVIKEIPKYSYVRHIDSSNNLIPSFINIANRSRESVVFIRGIEENGKSNKQKEYSTSTGSGVLISQNGQIVTNRHLIKDADYIEVTLHDNRVYKADLMGQDEFTDLALLRIEEENLESMFFGDSDSIYIGEWVLAIGNPYKLQSSVTAGIISAKARNLNLSDHYGIESFIQTDAAVNPGNSGGALINTEGKLIGINTAIISNSGTYEGFSFAIPSNIVKKVVRDIREFGAVQRAWLGVTLLDVDSKLANSLGLKEVKGLFIESVNPESAAAKAKLRKGDVILQLNGYPTANQAEFNGQLARFSPGEYITLQISRNGTLKDIEVTLHNYMNTTEFISIRKDKVLKDIGVEIRNLSDKEINMLGKNGIKVISVLRHSKADQVNIEPNLIITKVNDQNISNSQTFIEILKSKPDKISIEGIYPEYPGIYPYEITL